MRSVSGLQFYGELGTKPSDKTMHATSANHVSETVFGGKVLRQDEGQSTNLKQTIALYEDWNV